MPGRRKGRGRGKKFSTEEEIRADLEGGFRRRHSSSGESDDKSDEEEDAKFKGVTHLIDVSNPNHIPVRMKKIEELSLATSTRPQLSRREREAVAEQRAEEEAQTQLIAEEMKRLVTIREQRDKEQAKAEAEKELHEQQAARKAADVQAKLQQKLLNKQMKGRQTSKSKSKPKPATSPHE